MGRGDAPGGPEQVEGPSGRSGTGQGYLEEVREGSGNAPGAPERLGYPPGGP